MKKTFLLSALATLSLALVPSCSKDDGGAGNSSSNTGDGSSSAASNPEAPTYALVTNLSDPWWLTCKAGVNKAAADIGANVVFVMPDGTVEDQKAKVEDLIAQGIDGLAISPREPANMTSMINGWAEKVPLITQDSDAPETNRRCFIGVDNYDAGRLCGALVKEAIPDGGKIALFVADLGQDNAKGRRQGVIDEVLGRSHDPTRFDEPGSPLEGGGYTIIATYLDDGDGNKAKNNVEDAYTSNPDIAGYVGLFAYNPPAILEAMKGAGKLGKVAVIGFDEAPPTLAGIKAGHIHGTVVQDPYNYGYKSMIMLDKIHKGEDAGIPENKFVKIPAQQIRSSNVEEFEIELKKKQSGE